MKISKSKLILIMLPAFGLLSCNQTYEAPAEKAAEETSMEMEEAYGAETNVNTDSLVNQINEQRATIEQSLGEPVVLLTEELKAKIKQKWSKIHFYTKDGSVVRIKTYPYAEISKRTEEFYLENGKLILAVIEDDGTGDKGKLMEDLDKMYYYYNDKLIKEKKQNDEQEFSVRNSDAEELLEEVAEYLELYASMEK